MQPHFSMRFLTSTIPVAAVAYDIHLEDRDYLLQIKANQGDTLDALQHRFSQAFDSLVCLLLM